MSSSAIVSVPKAVRLVFPLQEGDERYEAFYVEAPSAEKYRLVSDWVNVLLKTGPLQGYKSIAIAIHAGGRFLKPKEKIQEVFFLNVPDSFLVFLPEDKCRPPGIPFC